MTDRGIVIVPRFNYDGRSLHFPGSVGIEPGDLRHYCLYWDRLDWPDNNLIKIGGGGEIDLLQQEGILSRTNVRATGSGDIPRGYVEAQFAVFDQYNQREPGRWAIAQSANTFINPRGEATNRRALEVELHNALPSPDPSAPLSDVLKFKERRESELLALREALDELYLRAVESSDVARAERAALLKLERSLSDLDRAARETWVSHFRRSMKVELKLSDAMSSAVIAALAGSQIGIPLALSGAVGALAASVTFEPRTIRAPDLPDGLQPFAYVFHAIQELRPPAA